MFQGVTLDTMMKSIILSASLLLSLFLQGCYTQLAMFYPEPEIESDEEEQFYDSYSRALPSLKGESYARDGRAAMPLAYSAMQRRFSSPYSGNYYGYNGFFDSYYYSDPFYNGLNGYRYGYNGYNSYGYAPYFYTDDPIGYGSLISTGNREKRKFRRDRSQGTTTMLYTTRSSSSSSDGSKTNTSSTYSTNSSSIYSSRSSGSYSSSNSSSSRSSSSASSSSGRRATRRE